MTRLRVCAFYFLGRQDFRSPRVILLIWQDTYIFCYSSSLPGRGEGGKGTPQSF